MSRQKVFATGVIVSSKFLNDQQQALTGASFGGVLTAHSSDAAKVSRVPDSSVSVAPLVLSSGTGAIADDYAVGYQEGPIHSTVASGTAGARNIWATTTDAAQLSTEGIYTLSVLPTADTPADTYRRKIGTAQWTGSALTTGRLTNGVQASAEQTNMFTFKSMFDSASDIPLTLQGGPNQGGANSTLLSAGFTTTGVYSQKWGLTAKGRVTTVQAASADEHYRAFVGADAQPILTLASGIKFGPGGAVAVDTTLARTGAGVMQLSHTLDVVSLQNSTGSGAVAGAVNVLDGLNITGGLTFTGVALASTHLSDSAALARLAGPALTGVPTAPTAAPGTNTTQLSTTAFVTAAGVVTASSAVTTANSYTDAASTNDRARANHTGVQAQSTITNLVSDLAANATADRARANHTGTQLAATISDFSTAVQVISYTEAEVDGLLSSNSTADRARAVHTGTQLANTISNFDTQVRANRLDQLTAPTASVAMGTQKLTGLAAGSGAGDSLRYEQVVGVYALLASPTFSGVPLADTATLGTDTTQLATTAFANAAAAASSAAASTTDRARANHTGVQAISTVTGLQAAIDAKADTSHTQSYTTITGFDAQVDARATVVAKTLPSVAVTSASTSLTLTAPVTILTSALNVGVTLPAAGSWGEKACYLKTGPLAESSSVTITPASGLIEGAANFVITNPNASIVLINDGTNWYVF